MLSILVLHVPYLRKGLEKAWQKSLVLCAKCSVKLNTRQTLILKRLSIARGGLRFFQSFGSLRVSIGLTLLLRRAASKPQQNEAMVLLFHDTEVHVHTDYGIYLVFLPH